MLKSKKSVEKKLKKSLLPSDRIDNLSSSLSSRISMMDSKCHVCSVGELCPGLSSETRAPSGVRLLKLSSISDMENPSLIECSGGGRGDFLVNSDFKGISLRNCKKGRTIGCKQSSRSFEFIGMLYYVSKGTHTVNSSD